MSKKDNIKLDQGGVTIEPIFGVRSRHTPYFWFGDCNDDFIGVLRNRNKVKKLKRLCEEFLDRTKKD